MARAQAFVFDAYDTLFEVHSVMVTLKDVTADAEAVSLQWRVKQLEYAWRHSLSGNSNSTILQSDFRQPSRSWCHRSTALRHRGWIVPSGAPWRHAEKCARSEVD
jgi:FMN phosphatase YigB (HAD superfamily)